MNSHPRIQNIAVLIVLTLIYLIPAFFLSNDATLDLVSVPLLIFGMWSFFLISGEAMQTFWEGQRGRAALALYGLFAIFLSVVATRLYGLTTRNLHGAGWLDESHIYSAAIYIQFIGLWMFTRGASTPTVGVSRSGWSQLIAGVVIGAIIASSKLLEPILVLVGKALSHFVR